MFVSNVILRVITMQMVLVYQLVLQLMGIIFKRMIVLLSFVMVKMVCFNSKEVSFVRKEKNKIK